MRLRTLALVTAGAVIFGAGGCTATPQNSGDGPTSRPPTTQSNVPAAQADPAVGSASVTDDAADASTADIRGVRLTIDDTALTVVFELSSKLPTVGTAQLSVTVASQDGSQKRQLGVKWIDGKPQVFVFDFVTSKQYNLAASAQQQDATVTVAFPAAAVAGIGESFEWHADSNVAGKDVDRAPDADRAKYPELP